MNGMDRSMIMETYKFGRTPIEIWRHCDTGEEIRLEPKRDKIDYWGMSFAAEVKYWEAKEEEYSLIGLGTSQRLAIEDLRRKIEKENAA